MKIYTKMSSSEKNCVDENPILNVIDEDLPVMLYGGDLILVEKSKTPKLICNSINYYRGSDPSYDKVLNEPSL